MLNLNCSICTELLKPSDEAYITTCGHMFHFACIVQWLKRSRTCPQCRSACKQGNIFRVYFNIANLETSRLDANVLLEEIDDMKLQMKLKVTELEKATNETKILQNLNIKHETTISKLESQQKKNQLLLDNAAAQIKLLKYQSLGIEELRQKIHQQKQLIETMEDLQTILHGTKSECEKLLKRESNPKTLALWISTLKRELRLCEIKKNDTRVLLKSIQNDLRKERDINKAQGQFIKELESENYILKEKLKHSTKEESSNLNLNLNTTLAKSTIGEEEQHLVTDMMKQKQQSKEFTQRTKECNEISDNTTQQPETSNSPYLNIKASSFGFVNIYNFQRKYASNGAWSNNHIYRSVTTKNLKVSPTKKLNDATLKSANVKMLAGIINKQRLQVTEEANILPPNSSSTDSKDLLRNGISKMQQSTEQYTQDDKRGSRLVENLKPLLSDTNDEKPKINSIDIRLKNGRLRNFQINKQCK